MFVKAGALLTVEQLQWAELGNTFLVDLWTGLDLGEEAVAKPGVEPVEVRNFEPLNRGLLISGQSDAFVDVLVPVGRPEWQVWTFFKEGAAAHRSFADLLRWMIARPVDEVPSGLKHESREQALTTLREAANKPDLETRRWAIGELVDRKAAGSVDRLRELASDRGQDPEARSLQKWAIFRLTQPDLVG